MNVLVVGAGVIGAAIAEELAHRGAHVTVLDMRSPGRGASQASAGILAPFIELHGHSALHELGRRSLDLYDAFVDRASRTSGVRVEYARSGTLEVALTESEAERLQTVRTSPERRGGTTEWFDARALRSFEPTLTETATGGLFTPAHGFVGVSSLVTALVSSARFVGAAFETSIEAVEVNSSHDHVRVRAGSQEYVTDTVVLASGTWSGRIRIAGARPIPVRPIRGQLLHLHWPRLLALPSRIVWGPACYVVPWTDGSMLVGATSEDVGFDESSTVEAVRDLSQAVGDLLPASRHASIEAVRVGLRPAMPDGLPAVGPLSRFPRVIVATGHFRNGVLLAPLTAKLVGDVLLEQRSDPLMALTTPDRFDGPGSPAPVAGTDPR